MKDLSIGEGSIEEGEGTQRETSIRPDGR